MKSSGVVSYGALGHVPPQLPKSHFSSLWSKPDVVCSLRD